MEYLKKCGGALKKGGFVIVKENLITDSKGEDVFDELDSSVTRYVRIIVKGGREE